MTNKVLEAIKELESIRLDLFRSAANLDKIIGNLELVKDDQAGSEYIRWYISHSMTARKEIARVCDWDKLNERENEIWQKLLNDM